ncbi:MAG TPA: chromosome segregation protein SMC, partial [bacterium]|nr:chromosome segregation protein SMC [bacterium]
AIANGNATMEHLERRHIDVTGRIARDQAEIDAIDARRKALSEEISRHERDLDGSRQLKLKLSEESESALSALVAQRSMLEEAESKLAALREEVSGKRQRLASLKDLRKNLEGYRDGVRAVLSRADEHGEKLEGVLGTVSEFVETEAEYEAALGAVLGEKLQYVVVKSHSEGVDAIEYLRTASSGRGTFIPLGVRAESSEGGTPTGEGVIGPITDVVRFADDYRRICEHLLGDVVLVDDIGRALKLWESGSYRKTFVTRDGCVVDPSGVVTGGASSGVEEQLIAQKRRIKELEDDISRMGGELTSAEGETAKLRDRVKSIEEHVEGLKKDAHGKDLHLVGQERDLERVRDEFARYEGERDRLTVETAALSEELSQIERERTEVRMRIDQHSGDRDRARDELSSVQAQLSELSPVLSAKEGGLIDLKVELAQAEERQLSVSREVASLVETKIEAELGMDRRTAELTLANGRMVVLARDVEDLRSGLDLSIRSIGGLQESKRVLQARFDAESASLRDRELEIREIRRRHDEALASFHETELRLTEHRAQLRYLADGIRERYHMDLASVEAEYARDDLDMETEEGAVAELKERVEKIGPVNVDAIKEFDELSERHDFLSRQNADLTASLDNLQKAITKINRTSRQRFRRAFEDVDAQFKELFPKLFRGGQARLMLTDEENLLETGVEIIAQPPGKKLQSITLLSGGEKALTAVALIFSIFLIKPSPFCLLDEVDAPLDDANVDRFNDLIRSMTGHSQFILITHNKRTMELADLLYGVTMEERGVSKMVSVKLGADRDLEPAVA